MDKKIKMGVIGLRFGRQHAKAIYDSEKADLTVVCDIDEERAKMYAEKYNVPYTTDYKEVLAMKDLDAISVAAPDQLHCEIVLSAIAAGKHVLCEKPLALKLDECKKMIEAAEKSGVTLMVGQICRYTPGFKKAKEIIDAGDIGDIFFIESEYAHDYSAMTCEWRKTPERHGLIGGGCHAVDLMRWIAGDPCEVFGYGNHMMLPDWPTDDCTIGIMKFPSGALGKVFCSTGCKRNYTMRTVIYGTLGTIIVDNKTPHMTLFRSEFEGEKMAYDSKAVNLSVQIPVSVEDHNIADEVEDFLDGILSGDGSRVTAKEGAYTVSVCTSILKACKSGLPEKVDYNF